MNADGWETQVQTQAQIGTTSNELNADAVTALLQPRSVTIIGASERSRWSRTAFDNMTGCGFQGELHLVNRSGGMVHDRPAATSCEALGESCDLGIIMVPAAGTDDALRDLAAAGGRSAIMLMSGFAETGAEGAARQAELATLARSLGIRLLGPNSLGYINFADASYAWTTPVRAPSRPSGVAVISQSGATAHFLATLAWQQDIGLSHVIATGNEIDLEASMFAHALLHHEATRAVALFLETLRDPQSFLALAKAALDARKPLVVLKVGASEVTAKSALAHTGALVGDDRVFDGICRQFGIIRVHSIEDLLATANIAALAGTLIPGGLGIVSNSGGVCEIAADSCAARGITLPELNAAASNGLQATIPGFATAHNPLDLTGAITPEQCGAAVDIIAAQPGMAAILCPYYELPVQEADMSERLSALHAALARSLTDAPVPGFVVSYTATHLTDLSKRIAAETGLPYLACGLDRALTGFAGVMRWSEHLRSRGIEAPAALRPITEKPRSEHAALSCLTASGVPAIPMTLATSEDDAVNATAALDGPVVLKIASPDIAHKSDIGGVVLNLQGDAAVRAAYRDIITKAREHAPHATIEGILVAPMRPHAVELFVGVTRDPQWGPVLALGLGGIFVEVLNDVALCMLPTNATEIRRMLTGLRGAKMLEGSRGLPAADLNAVARAIERIGAAALAFGPDLEALDINPLWVHGSRIEALDALCVWRDDITGA